MKPFFTVGLVTAGPVAAVAEEAQDEKADEGEDDETMDKAARLARDQGMAKQLRTERLGDDDLLAVIMVRYVTSTAGGR